MTISYKEKDVEQEIEESLIQSGFQKGNPHDYDKVSGLDLNALFDFLFSTQQEKMEKLQSQNKEKYKEVFVKRVDDEIKRRGLLDVLRHGISIFQIGTIKLAYFKPNSGLNKETLLLYNGNVLKVIRQVKFHLKREFSVDLVLFLNGFPIVTLELKNELTGQTVEHAMRQYKYDRNPQDFIFQFNTRSLVHFAVDTEQVFMTTKLDKHNTIFLPFNKGDNGGKGNPINPNGFKSAYLWEEVLQPDSLLDIVGRYLQTKKDNKRKPISLIFPRYHQLDVVRKVEEHVTRHGVGESYLVQHSAGSGKSNSISWLAYRLSNLHDTDNLPLFDSVIVITDRLVLDSQLKDNIYDFDHTKGVVAKVDDGSSQLAEELNKGTRIMITTLQKFGYILDKTGSLKDKKFAVIIDEAHNSQSGKYSTNLKSVLGDREEEDMQEAIVQTIKTKGKLSNVSYFAFTATPKPSTIELFGQKGENDVKEIFHLYSMKQAIQEGFILDVLKHYLSYQTLFRLQKKNPNDPELSQKQGKQAVNRYLQLHPEGIRSKTEIMTEHYREFIQHKINKQAKAMVVTSSRKQALRYYRAFNSYIEETGYKNINALIAFSGELEDNGIKVTEEMLNGFKSEELPVRFATDEYQFLIVAEKYQTGFDQPLLHTMYVDKMLKDIKAVQTLQRLNRTHPDKDDTFILDFANDPEEIQAAFKPYYEEAYIQEETDPNLIFDVQYQIESHPIYYEEEMEEFCTIYMDSSQEKHKLGLMNRELDKAVDRFRELELEEQEIFRSKSLRLIRLYDFLSQLYTFDDDKLDNIYLYCSFLLKKLPKKENEKILDLGKEVDLEFYKVREHKRGNYSLSHGEGDLGLTFDQDGTPMTDDPKVYLSKLIEYLNEHFGAEFTESDLSLIRQIEEECHDNLDLRQMIEAGNDFDNFKSEFQERFSNMIIERIDQYQDMVVKIETNNEMKEYISKKIAQQLFNEFKK